MSEKRMRRIGRFEMSEEVLESEKGKLIFKELEFIPLKVFKASEGYYSFTGYSDLFEEIDTSDFLNDIPNYVLTFDMDSYILEAEKI